MATPPGSKDLATNTLNFKPILDPPFEKNCKEDLRPQRGGALARLGHSIARVKIWGCSIP